MILIFYFFNSINMQKFRFLKWKLGWKLIQNHPWPETQPRLPPSWLETHPKLPPPWPESVTGPAETTLPLTKNHCLLPRTASRMTRTIVFPRYPARNHRSKPRLEAPLHCFIFSTHVRLSNPLSFSFKSQFPWLI